MANVRDNRNPDTLRVEYMERLVRESEQRYGRERTEELRPSIEKTADYMVTVALFPLGNEDRPAFLFTTTVPDQ